jgi:hypothetical protein
MTKPATTVSVKIPARLLDRIPAPGNGRSRFIIRALEGELSRKKRREWKPESPRGRKLAALLAKGKTERFPLLSEDQFDRELEERRGRAF